MFDINDFKDFLHNDTRYEKRINILKSKSINTESIEYTVCAAIENIFDKQINSFVIYWEPQSWKTEMMIALTAKLLDKWIKTIILLLNDNIQLLNQNLKRFRDSGLDPTPQNYKEIMDPSVDIKDLENVIFCKKNSSDLNKLIQRLWNIKNKVIIDDEADYATPNSKINNSEITKINELVGKLLQNDWYYIGVTATPARLDLNNTFNNSSKNWISFNPHPFYTWQDHFFPVTPNNIKFNLSLLPNTDDSLKYIKRALFSFMVNVAFLNIIDDWKEDNYSMLIHTSWKKTDHFKDFQDIQKIFWVLYNESWTKYEPYIKEIRKLAQNKYNWYEDNIVRYIITNRKRNAIILINSDWEKDQIPSAVDPSSLFTISIWWNIVSRGVTFNNLLSMFFTRDVKHKIQQDTYIQRARMFWARWKILKYFDLYIPKELYKDWHRCFVYHRLALESIRNGELVWFEDSRVSTVAAGSVDNSNISFSKWEMSFEIFDYNEKINEIISNDYWYNSLLKLEEIKKTIWDKGIPDFLISFIKNTIQWNTTLVWLYKSLDIKDRWDYVDREKIINHKWSFLTDLVRDRTYKDPLHKLRIFYNSKTWKARLFYKYDWYNINFVKNTKNDK